MCVVVPFLNEEWCLPTFLDSIATQTRRPDRLVLVDDGSTDRSAEIALKFARNRDWVDVLRLAPRRRGRDRLAQADELKAFQSAVAQLNEAWDVVAKMDADLELPRKAIQTIDDAFARDPSLGMAGTRLAERGSDGIRVPLISPPEHVEGATKFYRRACWEEIAPLPAILGWDTLDEFLARMRGWRTETFVVPGGDPLHLRRMGAHGRILRSFRRWGACAYGYGAHPLHVLLYGGRLMRIRRPWLIGGAHYMAGYAIAALRRAPRARADVRKAMRRQQMRKIRRRVATLLA
jgi:glycosyltransferase involved in cell wall biosynthesis